MAFCAQCGNAVSGGEKFCGSCGAPQALPGPNASSSSGPSLPQLFSSSRLADWRRLIPATRRARFIAGGVGGLVVILIFLFAVGPFSGGTSADGLASSYTCSGSQSGQLYTITITDPGGSNGRGMAGNVSIDGGPTISFANGEGVDPGRVHIVDFGQWEGGVSSYSSIAAFTNFPLAGTLEPDGTLNMGELGTCTP